MSNGSPCASECTHAEGHDDLARFSGCNTAMLEAHLELETTARMSMPTGAASLLHALLSQLVIQLPLLWV